MDPLVYFFPKGHAAHFEPGHPERPERLEAIRLGLQSAGLWDGYPQLKALGVPQHVLEGVHTHTYLQELQAAVRSGERLDADTYVTPSSWEIACRSAGGALAVSSAVWRGEARAGFALTRPPGHHATRERAMGFCLLNHIALAAEYLLQVEGARRLAIVDLDLHHGNGTQDIFWQRGDVFYLSVHQSPLYPGTGLLEETGEGQGLGATANFPLPPGTGDEGFEAVMQRLILPLLDRFQPEMLLVSVGFDPHWLDPLGHLRLSAAEMGSLIANLAGWAHRRAAGRIALILEGGYDLEAGAACAQAAIAALLHQPFTDPLGPSPRPGGNTWKAVVTRAQQIWGLA